jgi:hypothetical protein
MNANLENIAEELFGKIRTRFPTIQLGDEKGEVIANENDIGQARFFEFDYVKEGIPLGSVSIQLSEKNGLTVMYSNDLVEGQGQNLVNEWYGFLKSLREFAKKRLLNFDTRDLVKSNLDKRDYEFLAKTGEGQMTESKLWGTNRTSFQDMGEAKIIVKHSKNVNYDNPAGRTLHIESIFIENAEGERFKYPYKHLNGARALARHVAHGGTPYDQIGEHVIGLSEELSKLRFFKGYVSRQEQVSEAMGNVTDKVIERIDQVKKEIHQLQSESHYQSFVESFQTQEARAIPEDIMNDWVDRLTVRSFNEALKDVFPYIYKLVGEDGVQVKELSVDDIIGEAEEECEECGMLESKCECDDEIEESFDLVQEFENAIEQIVKEDDDLFSTDGQVQQSAIDKLNRLMAQELKAGPDGTNATMTLKGLIDDSEFTKTLKSLPAETDIRPLVKGYVDTNYPELADKLNFGSESGVDSSSPAEPPAPAAAPAEAPPAAPEATAAPAEQPAPATESTDRKSKGGAREVVEFIKSFYDRDRGTFPKGEMGVMIAAKKEFGDHVVPVAKRVIETLSTIGQPKRAEHEEMEGIKKLAGLNRGEVEEEMPPMIDPNAMMKQQMDRMQGKMPNLDPATMMKSQQDRIANMKTKMPTDGGDSYKVNGKPVSKQEYDAFMAQHPELAQNMKDPMNVVKGNPELARIKKMAGMSNDNDW